MKAYELLANPESWTTGFYATDKEDRPCHTLGPDACRWCMAGALIRCYPGKCVRAPLDQIIQDRFKFPSLESWQDEPGRTHAEVLALLKEVDL